MRIVQLYNRQRAAFGGEESVIANTRALLRAHGHTVTIAVRDSRSIESSLAKKAAAGIRGIYSLSGVGAVTNIIRTARPDVIHAHGVYPQWSPAIFRTCWRLGVPTVLHIHSHYLTCPNWYHFRNGRICELCFGGHEQWCVLKNCRNAYAESMAYTLRSYVNRRMGFFTAYVGCFLAVSEFVKERLVKAGFREDRITVLPNVIYDSDGRETLDNTSGRYIAYCGRLSPEKGVMTLLDAAGKNGLPVWIAGEGPQRASLERSAPGNVKFLGYLNRHELRQFYRNCRFLVVPSVSLETFCMSAAEAMMQGKAVIAARVGALPEVVKHESTGLLFEPGDASTLAALMSALWNDPERSNRYGSAARSLICSRCSEESHYSRLMSAYSYAAQVCRSKECERAVGHV